MGTFYLGLSMAGTVSAGTYTGGTLVEINSWLASWQKAKLNGLTLKATKNTPHYKIGDDVVIPAAEVPKHQVKIKAMSGASGGTVNAALFISGLTLGTVEALIRDTWTYFDVKDMLKTTDLASGKPIYSILNVGPIDDMKKKLETQKWTETDFAAKLDYLDDNIEIFATLASYEGIPFKTTAAIGNSKSYGVHRTHLDYIKFNFQKQAGTPSTNNVPYAYNLAFRSGHFFKDDNNWQKLVDSAPASAAFPIGFKPRALRRFRKEYDGKLFYLNYSMPSRNVNYAELAPAWPAGNPDDTFDMEYMDGGTFNREPHDLARASIIQSLNLPNGEIPNDGMSTNACVILIDPFPSNFDTQTQPGEQVKEIPTLFAQAPLIIGALMDQGRFRPDWIEKAMDDSYYSRYLISPIRMVNNEPADLPLAAGLLGAFSGFIDQSFREHDYKLGHYNTFQFLKNYFAVPVGNVEIDYYEKADDAAKEKYEAVGWYIPKQGNEKFNHCQIIPRTVEPGLFNSLQQPEWPSISNDKWQEIRGMAMNRAKELADSVTDLSWVLEHTLDKAIWLFLKGKVDAVLDTIEKDLVKNGLLRKK